MKISGITRDRMKAELDKLFNERALAAFYDQCVSMPLRAPGRAIFNDPDNEEKDAFEESFKRIPDYKDEYFDYFLAFHMHSVYFTMATHMLDFDSLEENIIRKADKTVQHYADKFSLVMQKSLEENPYIKKMKFENYKEEEETLTLKNYERLCIFPTASCHERGYFYEHNVAVAAEELTLPVIDAGNSIEKVSPTEICLTKKAIDAATGNVIAMDTSGLQYFAYMAHLKPDVKSVIILMNGGSKAELFKKYILPKFEYPEKITLMIDSSETFVEELKNKQYNFCFARLWNECRTNLDLYINVLEISKLKPDVKFMCYMEEYLLEHAKNIITIELSKQTSHHIKMGVQASDEGVIAVLDKFKDISILTPDALRNIFLSGKVKEILKK